jgi:sigma-E factor negative regulatory protein RseA
MKETDKERISALLDGELPEGEAAGCLDRLTRDADLRSAWGRYHLIGDALRGEPLSLPVGGLAERVSAALEREPAILAAPARRASKPKGRPEWLRPLAGAAIAASVAVVTLVSYPYLVGDGQAPTSAAVVKATAAPPPLAVRYANHAGTHWKNRQRPEVESRLNRYLVDHNEYAAPAGMTGVLPYASFVSYDENR